MNNNNQKPTQIHSGVCVYSPDVPDTRGSEEKEQVDPPDPGQIEEKAHWSSPESPLFLTATGGASAGGCRLLICIDPAQ